MATFEWDPANLQMLPEHLRDGMQRYIEKGINPGAGLRSILMDGRLSLVVTACDAQTVAALREIYLFLYNRAPGAAWGSQTRVAEWVAAGGIEGQS